MTSSPRHRLNNFVTDLLRSKVSDKGIRRLSFETPRTGWILIRAENPGPPGVRVRVSLNEASEEPVIGILGASIRTIEGMRYLEAGDHRVIVNANGPHEITVTARTIPEIIYANYPGKPHFQEYGDYDWAFLNRIGILSSANVMITGKPEGEWTEEWKRVGKRILQQVGVPGRKKGATIDRESAHAYWSQSPGWQSHMASGLIADEFLAHWDGKVAVWSDAIRRLLSDRPDRVFYPYVSGDAQGQEPLIRSLADTCCRFAWERYLKEQPTEGEALDCLEAKLKRAVRGFSTIMPDFTERLILVLGLLCGPPETLNTNPSVNYKVFMDMQFNLVANDAAFKGIYGIEEYLSSYADEEYLRWAAHLYRHYCIEGRRERATRDPYHLDHIDNPDFARGLDGWTVTPARSGSIGVEEMEGIAWLQGRYPRDKEGDRYLCMTRSLDGPNTVSQGVRNLEGDRVYSLKMYIWDPDNLTQGREHALDIEIEGTQILPRYSFQGVFPSCYDHHIPRFGDEEAYFNLRRMVFRPPDGDAKLEISDWTRSEPAGPVGQRLAINFVEIEPFFTGGSDPHDSP